MVSIGDYVYDRTMRRMKDGDLDGSLLDEVERDVPEFKKEKYEAIRDVVKAEFGSVDNMKKMGRFLSDVEMPDYLKWKNIERAARLYVRVNKILKEWGNDLGSELILKKEMSDDDRRVVESYLREVHKIK